MSSIGSVNNTDDTDIGKVILTYSTIGKICGGEFSPLDSYTKLLLHMDGTNNSQLFYDDSNACKFGTGAAYFDGNGDYLSLDASDDWDFLGGDFTIDLWVKFLSLPTDTVALVNRWTWGDASHSSWIAQYYNNNFTLVVSTAGGTFQVSKSCTPNLGQWYHVAFIRNGSNIYVSVDGSLSAGSEVSGNLYSPSLGIKIGKEAAYSSGNTSYLDGYLDEVRISKGIARWTSNFTSPISQYSTDSYTKLLLHMDGSKGSTTFTDSSGTSKSVTASGNTRVLNGEVISVSGDAKISTAQYKFGQSGYFDGSSSYLSINNANLNFGTADFTIDTWFRAGSQVVSYPIIVTSNTGGTYGSGSLFVSDGSSSGYPSFSIGSARVIASDSSVLDSNWHHMALSRQSGIFYLFIDGILKGSSDGYLTTNVNFSATTIGYASYSPSNTSYLGYIDELRISKGIARWTSNFTPPSSPY